MDWLHWIAERRIKTAIEEGAFDDLAGQGRPLELSPLDDVYSGEWRLAHRILHNAGMAPRWIELDRQIRQEARAARADLRRARARWPQGGPAWQRAIERFRAKAERVNGWILTRNILAPRSVQPRSSLRIDLELSRLAGSRSIKRKGPTQD